MTSELSLQYAASVARRVHERPAPIRWSFVRSFDTPPSIPPMTRLMRGGRGGSVRLKLYLSFLWFAAAPPHDVTYPARAWAGLLDLEDPERNGARRVVDAISTLQKHRLVWADRRQGRPTQVRLLKEDGSGEPYELPGATVETLLAKDVTGPDLQRHYYTKLPASVWTNGWIQALSGPGLAMLLVLLTELGDNDAATRELWLSPGEADRRIGLSEETRSVGLRQLRELELVRMHRRSINRDIFDFRRMRNVYVLQPGRLEGTPA